MEYRGFIQFALLLLALGCFALGLDVTLTTLMVLCTVIELIARSRVLEHEVEEEIGRIS